MIKRTTTLILGAGASREYGYPTARGLVKDVIRVLMDGNQQSLIEAVGVKPFECQDFCNDLIRNSPPSVDTFLEYRNEFLDVGKYAIALALQPREKRGALSGGWDYQPHWYAHLLAALRAPKNAFKKNQLSIVTFNYDRSLKEFLFNATQSMYGLTSEEAADFVDHLSIIHIHGDLGPLTWQQADARPYGGAFTAQALSAVKDSLQVIHENIREDVLKEATTRIQAAESIVFLGFGYHEANLHRLGLQHLNGRSCFGSAYGMTELEMERIRSRWPIRLDATCDKKCLDYLRHRTKLDW